MRRREFVIRAASVAAVAAIGERAVAQGQPQQGAANVAMDQDAAKSVRRPPKSSWVVRMPVSTMYAFTPAPESA